MAQDHDFEHDDYDEDFVESTITCPNCDEETLTETRPGHWVCENRSCGYTEER